MLLGHRLPHLTASDTCGKSPLPHTLEALDLDSLSCTPLYHLEVSQRAS